MGQGFQKCSCQCVPVSLNAAMFPVACVQVTVSESICQKPHCANAFCNCSQNWPASLSGASSSCSTLVLPEVAVCLGAIATRVVRGNEPNDPPCRTFRAVRRWLVEPRTIEPAEYFVIFDVDFLNSGVSVHCIEFAFHCLQYLQWLHWVACWYFDTRKSTDELRHSYSCHLPSFLFCSPENDRIQTLASISRICFRLFKF